MPFSKKPLADISNSKKLSQGCLKKSVSIGVDSSPVVEVVDVNNENKYVPDSISPSSVPGYSRFFSKKVSLLFISSLYFLPPFFLVLFILTFFVLLICLQHSNVGSIKKNGLPCSNVSFLIYFPFYIHIT